MSDAGDDGGAFNSPPSSPARRASSSRHSRSSRASSVSSLRSSRSGRSSRSRSSSRGPDVVAAPIAEPHHGHTSSHHHDSHHHDSHHHDHGTHEPTKHEHHEAPAPMHISEPTSSNSILPHLAIPVALIISAAIIGGGIYAVVSSVQDLVATASVDGDLGGWKRKARFDVYDGCYLGCTTCDDPNFAYNACQKTAQAVVPGINCDAGRMWNWATEDRYPDKCLTAVAGILMGDELERVKQSYRNRFALVILPIVGGFLIGFIIYKVWRRRTLSTTQRIEDRYSRKWSFFKPWTWHLPQISRVSKKEKQDARSLASSATPSKKSQGNKKKAALFLGLFGSRAAAYPCTGRNVAWTQFFTSPNGTVSGTVHGWFSECNDRQDCRESCTKSCTTCTRTCKTKCTTYTTTTRVPMDFVDAVLPKVRACGFSLVDGLAGSTPTVRVANAGIEKNHWVRISVNGLNVTKPTETDKMVMCLHAIGDE